MCDQSITIPLTQGKVAVIDAADYPLVSPYRWHAALIKKRWYARTVKSGRRLYMHRLIMGAQPGEQVDHQDLDGLNNRRSNLRYCNDSENQTNKPLRADSTSGYKGVRFFKRDGTWYAAITKDRITYSLGYHKTAEEAARVYDRAARHLHGPFARANFPGDDAGLPDAVELSSRNTSGYRGVTWNKGAQKWMAEVTIDGKRKYLGLYDTAEAAGAACERARNSESVVPPAEGRKTSRFRGVAWREKRQMWEATIAVNGEDHFLGRFKVEEDAARAYDAKARELHGAKARLNFPD